MTRRTTSRLLSLSASLALILATVVIGGPAAAEHDTASDAPTLASVDASPATETESGDDQDGAEPITFDEVYELVAQLAADGQILRYAENQLRFTLYVLERIYIGDGCTIDYVREHYFKNIERFQRWASDPRYVLTESARDQLLAAADQLAQLCEAQAAGG